MVLDRCSTEGEGSLKLACSEGCVADCLIYLKVSQSIAYCLEEGMTQPDYEIVNVQEDRAIGVILEQGNKRSSLHSLKSKPVQAQS